MPTPSDLKILMLMKMTRRTAKQKATVEAQLASANAQIGILQTRTRLLMTRLRGDAAKPPVPEALMPSYNWALDYVTANKYQNGTRISAWKDVALTSQSDVNISGKPVIDWLIHRIEDGLYDLEFVKEWTY